MRKFLSLGMTLALVFGAAFSGGAYKTVPATGDVQAAAVQVIPHELAPMDREAMINMLMEQGKIKAGATSADIQAALKEYIGNVVINKETTPQSKKIASSMEQKLQESLKQAVFNGKKLGQNKNGIIDPITPTPLNNSSKQIKVLVLLAEYADFNHNSIKKPATTKSSYWTQDFTVDHYRNLLFSENGYTTPENVYSPSLRSYFKEQSSGNLDITGEVYGWVKLSMPAKYYGEDIGGRGNDRAPKEMVEEAARLAVEQYGINLKDYDQDGDGIVDHLMVLHAGVGQESNGGALGTDAVWSHSWDLNAPTAVDNSGTKIYSYTTEPENGAVGVMAHEFVHDLGMPDDYDTIYSGDGDPVEYWSIMSGGSYTGRPSGTMPSGINPWSRIMLQFAQDTPSWINWQYTTYKDLPSGTKLQLDTASLKGNGLQALMVELPMQIKVTNVPTEGTKEFWGGTGSEIDNNMTLSIDLTNKKSAAISYDLWFDIEDGWDAGFIQVSEDGQNWKSLSTPYTKTFENANGYPSIMDSLPAYSGSSNGWLKENVDLSAYAGKNIKLRFRYATDWGTELPGMYVDNIKATADGAQIAFEGAENGFGSLVNNGFAISEGKTEAQHFYVAEWRSHLGLDEGLKHIWAADFSYNEGLLLWYRNYAYDRNWMGVHPGYGYLGAVDANQYVYVDNGIGNGNENQTRAGFIPSIQMHDAAFSPDKSPNIDLSVYRGLYYKNVMLNGTQAVPTFSDSNSYWTPKSPHSGLKLPYYGLKIKVTGKALDYSRGEILISK